MSEAMIEKYLAGLRFHRGNFGVLGRDLADSVPRNVEVVGERDPVFSVLLPLRFAQRLPCR